MIPASRRKTHGKYTNSGENAGEFFEILRYLGTLFHCSCFFATFCHSPPAKQMISTTEAIILKSLKYRDSSKILTVYSAEFGRCSLVANGARKAKNKFGSALEPMSCSTLTFYKHRGKDLHTLSNAETSVPLRNLMDSFDRITAGLAVCEIVYASQVHEEQNLAIFDLLRRTLVALNASERNEQTLVLWFQAHYAALLGFRLAPTVCAATGIAVQASDAPTFTISLADGAPYSPPHALLNIGFQMDAGTLAVLQRLMIIPVEQASMLALSERQQSQMGDFFAMYYQFHLDRNLGDRTRRFLQAAQNE